jgi:hypothetical protein
VNTRAFRPIIASLAVLVSLFMASPASAAPWPGGSAVADADAAGVFGSNLSGLAYESSGSSSPGILWAVRNTPSTLFRLVWNGSIWTPDTANGWGAGKTLLYPGGVGAPDAEGVTLAEGDPNAVYVASERDGGGVSRPSVLRYDVSAAGATLTATHEFNLTANLPGLGANTGPEGVGWVPDAFLVSRGFKDEATGLAYSPATYSNHGTGLFFVGVEQNGQIVAYALNQSTSTFTRVATVASGLAEVMEVTYEPESGRLWAACDNHCNGQANTLDIAQSGPSAGTFVVTNTYDRPAGMPNLNNEGFTIAPQAECANGLKPVFYSDDDNSGGHALRAGTVNCTSGTTPPGGGTAPPTGGGSDTKVNGSASIAKNQKQKGKLKPAKSKDAAKIAEVLADGKKAKASVSITLADAAGNRSKQSLGAKLTS